MQSHNHETGQKKSCKKLLFQNLCIIQTNLKQFASIYIPWFWIISLVSRAEMHIPVTYSDISETQEMKHVNISSKKTRRNRPIWNFLMEVRNVIRQHLQFIHIFFTRIAAIRWVSDGSGYKKTDVEIRLKWKLILLWYS